MEVVSGCDTVRSVFSVVCSPRYISDCTVAKPEPQQRSIQEPMGYAGQDYHLRMTSNICPGSGLVFDAAADRDAMIFQISNTTALQARPCPFTTNTSTQNLELSVPSNNTNSYVVLRMSYRSCLGEQRARDILWTWSELIGAHQ